MLNLKKVSIVRNSKSLKPDLKPNYFNSDRIMPLPVLFPHRIASVLLQVLDFDTRSAIAKESISRVCEESQGSPASQVSVRGI